MLTSAFWQDVADRAVRQAFVILGPILVVVAGGTTEGINYRATSVAVAVGVLGTVLLAVAGATLDAEAPLPLQLAERALKAGAGALVGLLATGAGDHLLSVPWQSAVLAALGAAVTSVLANQISPPARRDLDLAA